MCHMLADTVEELHAMADRLGLLREWFQTHPPHYDICKASRAKAISYGAVSADRRKVVELIRAWRADTTDDRRGA